MSRAAPRCVRGSLTALLLIASIGLSACLHSAHVLTYGDDGTILAVDVGDVIFIRLSGNASTGYLWERTAPTPFESEPLAIVVEGDYESLGHAPGSPGLFTFGYAAATAGTITLAFAYRRPWENDPPLSTYSVAVWVR